MPEEIGQSLALSAEAIRLGADAVGIAPPRLDPVHEQTFRQWIAAGCQADMEYLTRRIQKGQGMAEAIFPEVRSVLVVALDYWIAPDEDQRNSASGVFSRYACWRDYHKTLKKVLAQLSRFLHEKFGAKTRICVDTSPLLERAYAQAAGLGWIGRNSCLITPQFGSWVVLGVLLTDLALPPVAAPMAAQCGDCRRCLDFCPTGALLENRTLDARRCLSYLTIENRGPLPPEMRRKQGTAIFGCDRCQEVCPYNRRNKTESDCGLRKKKMSLYCHLAELFEFADRDSFLARFAGTPVVRARRRGLLRNACVAAANSRNSDLLPVLLKFCQTENDPMLLMHAHWAINELQHARTYQERS